MIKILIAVLPAPLYTVFWPQPNLQLFFYIKSQLIFSSDQYSARSFSLLVLYHRRNGVLEYCTPLAHFSTPAQESRSTAVLYYSSTGLLEYCTPLAHLLEGGVTATPKSERPARVSPKLRTRGRTYPWITKEPSGRVL
jgi:hypothetical protein